jgi:hypothetical protein
VQGTIDGPLGDTAEASQLQRGDHP